MFDAAKVVKECREGAGADLSTLSDDEVLAAALAWESLRSAAEVGAARMLGELQTRGVTDRCFGSKTAAWVASEAGVQRAGVSRRLRIGQQVRRLSPVHEAVASGAISADHAAELGRATVNPRAGEEIEAGLPLWIDLARSTSFADWQHQLSQTVALLDQDGGYDPDRDLARNSLRLIPFPDGSVGIAGELVGEQALVVRQSVEAHADRLYLRLRRDHDLCPELPLPKRATVLAMALAELVSRGITVDPDHSAGPACDVTLIIEATRPGHAGTDRTRELDPFDPYRLDGSAPLLERCGPATTPDGFHVHHAVADCLLCDPVITALVVDSLGVPLDMGRKIRLANRDQRRALAHRDGGCVFPGCDAPVGWCDSHHVAWWRNLGPTDIDNLALLCRYHHGVSHRAGWTMTAMLDQTFVWRTPLDQTLHSQRHRGRSPTGHLQPA